LTAPTASATSSRRAGCAELIARANAFPLRRWLWSLPAQVSDGRSRKRDALEDGHFPGLPRRARYQAVVRFDRCVDRGQRHDRARECEARCSKTESHENSLEKYTSRNGCELDRTGR